MVFNGALTLASILFALFVFLFVQYPDARGFPGDGTWYMWGASIVGVLVISSVLCAVISFCRTITTWQHEDKLFVATIVLVGLLPIVGLAKLWIAKLWI